VDAPTCQRYVHDRNYIEKSAARQPLILPMHWRRWHVCVLLIKSEVKIISSVRSEEYVYRFLILKGPERCGAEARETQLMVDLA
jgi:hypothetical protein